MLSTNINVLVPVLFVLLLGYLGWRAKAFNAIQVSGLNKLTLDFALPASLFVGIANISRTQLTQDVPFVLGVLITLVVLYLLALVVGMKLLRLKANAAALFALGAAFPSAPFFGPAVLGGYFGPRAALAIASVAIVANLLLMPVTVVLLEVAERAAATSESEPATNPAAANDASGGKPASTGDVIRDGMLHAIQRPYVLAPVAALVLVLFGVKVPSLIISMADLIGRTTAGISLFVSGLLLAAFSPRLNGAVSLNVIFKSLAQPALMFALIGVLGLPKPLASEAVVTMALPSAVITPMLAARYGTYQSEAGSNMLFTAILMMLVVPAAMFVMR
jgi:hypothetical protein